MRLLAILHYNKQKPPSHPISQLHYYSVTMCTAPNASTSGPLAIDLTCRCPVTGSSIPRSLRDNTAFTVRCSAASLSADVSSSLISNIALEYLPLTTAWRPATRSADAFHRFFNCALVLKSISLLPFLRLSPSPMAVRGSGLPAVPHFLHYSRPVLAVSSAAVSLSPRPHRSSAGELERSGVQ